MIKVPLENKLENIDNIVTHKKLFLDSCSKMAKYLMKNGKENLSLKLMKRAFTHDLSKLSASEFYAMSSFSGDISDLKDPSKGLSEGMKTFLELHWKNNSHHPEHWEDLNDMGELDIIEMVCDWHCRSVEFGTNLLEFVEVRQKNRFNFPDDIYKKIIKYCKILLSL